MKIITLEESNKICKMRACSRCGFYLCAFLELVDPIEYEELLSKVDPKKETILTTIGYKCDNCLRFVPLETKKKDNECKHGNSIDSPGYACLGCYNEARMNKKPKSRPHKERRT